MVEAAPVTMIAWPATGDRLAPNTLPCRSVTLIAGSVPLSVALAFSSQIAVEVGQLPGTGGFGSGSGVTCAVTTPVTSMLSSHQPSSCGVSLQPGPNSKYESE